MGGGADPRPLRKTIFCDFKSGTFWNEKLYKNCFFCLSKKIHPYGRLIQVSLKSVFFSFRFPLYINFFMGHLKFVMPFSMSEFSGFKNLYTYFSAKFVPYLYTFSFLLFATTEEIE